MCSACPDCTWCLFKTCSFLLGTAIFENQICSYVELLIWVRRKSSLSRYLLGWNLFLTQETQLRILGSCVQSLIPNFFMKHLLLVNCLMQNSQTGRALQLSQWISCEESFPAHPGANKYPVRRNILWGMIPAHPGVAELPVEGSRPVQAPRGGPWAVSLSFIRAGHSLSACAHQIGPNLKVTLVFGKAKPWWALKSPGTITSLAVLLLRMLELA